MQSCVANTYISDRCISLLYAIANEKMKMKMNNKNGTPSVLNAIFRMYLTLNIVLYENVACVICLNSMLINNCDNLEYYPPSLRVPFSLSLWLLLALL